MSITFAIETITPEIAAGWLELNTENFRKLDCRRVSKYAKEMDSGNWALNGEAIKFSNTKLLDGQHRLAAVVQSKATIQSIVVRNIVASPSTIDRGKPRTIAQWLSHEGIPGSTNIAASARLALMHECGWWSKESVGTEQITDSEIIEFALSYQSELIDANRLCGNVSIMPRSAAAAIVFCGSGLGLASKNEVATWFINAINTGVDLCATDPALHFRNRMINDGSGRAAKTSATMKRMLCTVAWNKTVEGEEMKTLRITLTGPAKTKLPNEILRAS